MRAELEGWYPKTAEQVSAIWGKALFVPDANILLHCIRHPKAVREELLRLFNALKPSLWIPYQVALEFHRNRLDVERSGLDAYDLVSRECEKAIRQVRDQLRQLRAHPTIDIERELAALDMYFEDFKRRIEGAYTEHPSGDIGAVVDRLTSVFTDRVGGRWPLEDLAKLKKEGEARYAGGVPPGYLDATKNGDAYQKYGDLIIWKDMIAKAKTDQRPIIFISDDVKKDWWWIHKGKKIGPRPELVEEFKRESGQDFHIYEFSNFIRVAASYHPEFERELQTVEKSIRQDNVAKELQSQGDADHEKNKKIVELEHERDDLIALLSGNYENLASEASSVDRLSIKRRIKEIDEIMKGKQEDLD